MNISKKLYCKLGDPPAVLSSLDKLRLYPRGKNRSSLIDDVRIYNLADEFIAVQTL